MTHGRRDEMTLAAAPMAVGEDQRIRRTMDGPLDPTQTRSPIGTRLTVDVVSGNALPVALTGVEATYRCRSGSTHTVRGRTDVDGRAEIVAIHGDLPIEVEIVVPGHAGETHPVARQSWVVVEL